MSASSSLRNTVSDPHSSQTPTFFEGTSSPYILLHETHCLLAESLFTIISLEESISTTRSSFDPSASSRRFSKSFPWFRFRGKPARTNDLPLIESSFFFKIFRTISSSTSFPEFIKGSISLPIDVACTTSSRKRSPVEMCTQPKRTSMNFAIVPFPVPGGPRRTSFITITKEERDRKFIKCEG